ncbi:Branched-chain-amino-acid aminotransferase-like protein 2 [Glycine soja]|nr:Branched-chain-amino-acid aminotransferase-like protein 2 [Glycine soja]
MQKQMMQSCSTKMVIYQKPMQLTLYVLKFALKFALKLALTFVVKKGRVLTPHADYCLPGITRATVIDLVVKEQLTLEERRISLSEVHTADEVWTTGTMGELSPVVKVDGRIIGNGEVGPVTRRLQAAYKKLTEQSGVPIPTYLKT